MNVARRAWLRATPVLVAAALAACASPPSHYYQMQALSGAVRNGPAFALNVRSVSIPGYLDKDGIVKQSGDYQFATYPNDLWAEPLADMLQAVMVQNLQTRLPGTTVIGSGGSISAPADVLVEINVLHFDPDANGDILLNAQVAVKAGAGRRLLMTQTIQASAKPAGPDVTDTVAAMSTLWAQAADQIAGFAAQAAAGDN